MLATFTLPLTLRVIVRLTRLRWGRRSKRFIGAAVGLAVVCAVTLSWLAAG
jgi:tetrahydromethanopterin S-methyltransferase subunit F